MKKKSKTKFFSKNIYNDYLFWLAITVSLLMPNVFFPSAIEAEEASRLSPYSILRDNGLLPEGSAFFKSPNLENVFWAVNDSKNAPALFAFDASGEMILPDNNVSSQPYKGITVSNASNRDWEALAGDDKGNIIICDAGNNKNMRKDLAVYLLPEPDPRVDLASKPAEKIFFSYPDQKKFPPKKKNFDSEACFWHDGHLFLFTKNRADSKTKLYRFPSLNPKKKQVLKLIGSFETGGMVTDAAVNASGNRIAVLTYYGAYLLEKGKKKKILSWHRKFYPFSAGQCEGITFADDETLLITNENRNIYRISVSDFR
ncbi:MAG: hypothetical protein K5838_04185 [Elusimicrobiales bacterium]|nr:hypothetical protein [Elusimicrobiales bacterium]